jgi:ribulose-5-phosphate 4-epimerase/fuculose-1-phosphate aldolase
MLLRRPQVSAVLPGMFSACAEAAARGWVTAGQTNAEVRMAAAGYTVLRVYTGNSCH